MRFPVLTTLTRLAIKISAVRAAPENLSRDTTEDGKKTWAVIVRSAELALAPPASHAAVLARISKPELSQTSRIDRLSDILNCRY